MAPTTTSQLNSSRYLAGVCARRSRAAPAVVSQAELVRRWRPDGARPATDPRGRVWTADGSWPRALPRELRSPGQPTLTGASGDEVRLDVLACAVGDPMPADGSGDQNRASVRQDRPRLLAPERPRQTDDGGAVHNWKESRARPLDDGQRRPVSEKSGSRGRSQLAYTRERECRTRLEDRARLAIRQQKRKNEGAHLPAG